MELQLLPALSPGMTRPDSAPVIFDDGGLTVSLFPAIVDHMSYPGGKAGDGVYQRLISLMPPHDVYIEPFLGGGALLQRKRPARLTIGVDLDVEVIQQWQARTAIPGETSGRIATAGESAGTLATYDETGFRFHAGDGLAFLRAYPFTGHELVYCDPPYVLSTRAGRQYRHEMTDAQHTALLAIITALPCRVMISGYWTALYAEALDGWTTITYEAMTRGGRLATEWLWMNYPRPLRLHDYRFLGEGFRERERIKRKQARWVTRLQTMPRLERQALLRAVAEAFPATADIAGHGEGNNASSPRQP